MLAQAGRPADRVGRALRVSAEVESPIPVPRLERVSYELSVSFAAEAAGVRRGGRTFDLRSELWWHVGGRL